MSRKQALQELLGKVEAGWPEHIDQAYMPPFLAAFDMFPKAKKLSVDPARIVQIYEAYYRAAWEARAAWERGLFVSRTSGSVNGRPSDAAISP